METVLEKMKTTVSALTTTSFLFDKSGFKPTTKSPAKSIRYKATSINRIPALVTETHVISALLGSVIILLMLLVAWKISKRRRNHAHIR